MWSKLHYLIHPRNILYNLHRTQAAKETGALQAAKEKLEKEVEELTLLLQQEKHMRVLN